MCAFLLICLADLPQNCGTYFYIWNLFNTTHGSFGNKVTAVILLIAHIQPDYIRYFCSQVQSYSTSVKVHLFDLILSLMPFFFFNADGRQRPPCASQWRGTVRLWGEQSQTTTRSSPLSEETWTAWRRSSTSSRRITRRWDCCQNEGYKRLNSVYISIIIIFFTRHKFI